MTDDSPPRLEPEKRFTLIGFAHILQVVQIIFILGVGAAFIMTRWDLESMKTTYSLDRTNMEIRVGIVEKTLARQETEIHDYIVHSGEALQKINDALTDLRLRSGQGKRG